MKKFPILKLPLLATEEVLKQLRFGDLYNLSMCSKRCSKMISLANTRKHTLDIQPSFSFLFLEVDNFPLKIPKDEQKRNSGDPTFIVRNFEKLRAEFSHLLTTFKFHQKSFHSSGIWTLEQNQLLLETIIKYHGNTFENFTLEGNYGEMSNQWILENIKVNNILTTYAPFPQEGFIFKSCPNVLLSRGSSWFTLDTLISLGSCKAIELNKTVLLTITEINTFMETWKKDKFPNLEYLYLGDMKWKDNEMILGFTRQQLSVKREEKRKKKIGYDTYDCIGGVDIQSDCGVNGTIYFDADLVSVSFFVWKD